VDFAALRAFVSVAEHQSFSMAASVLFLSQSAISKRISGLEMTLNCRLFDRIGRKTLLTEAGLALLPRAHQILAAVEDSRHALHNLTGKIAGEVKIATSHHIGLHRLPPVLKAYIRRYQDVSLDMRFLNSEAACHSVEQGEVDLAIITLPLYQHHKLSYTPRWTDPLVFVAGLDHPLCSTSAIETSELVTHRAILSAPDTYTRAILDSALAAQHVTIQTCLVTNYMETIRMMVSIGMGWSLLPKSMVTNELKVLTVNDIQLSRMLGTVTHLDRTLSNASKALLETLQQFR